MGSEGIMFNAGLATTKVIFQAPLESTDANGAPIRTWLQIRECFCQVENEQVSATETIQAPYGQNTRQFTLIARYTKSPQLNVRDRVIASDSSWVGAITGIRYSALKDVMYVDVETGGSEG